jgi:hypothetical protein
MDLLLIEPPYKSLKGVGAECGYTMSLTSLAAYLAQHGFDTGVVTGTAWTRTAAAATPCATA